MTQPTTAEEIKAARRDLGSRLATYRLQAGYTQRSLAAAVRYSHSAICDAETGRHNLARDFWERCERVLKLPLGQLTAAHDRITALTAVLRAHRSARRAAQRGAARPPANVPAPSTRPLAVVILWDNGATTISDG